MRFLFINQYYAPDYAATAQQMQDICELLAAEGHDVHVLCGDRIYDGRAMHLPARENLNGVHVHRVRIAAGCRRRFRDRVREYAAFYAAAFVRSHRLPRPDVVVSLTTPPLISLLGTWKRIFSRSKFVYWVMDIYPDVARRAGVLDRYGAVSGIWAALGQISYRTANHVVALGEDMKQVLLSKGVPEQKISVVPSWSCGDTIQPLSPAENTFRLQHVEDGAFTLMYSGNMGVCHNFRSVIEGIRTLTESGEPFRFTFVGGGKREGELRDRLAQCNGAVRFLPWQDRTRLAESLSAPDAHLVTLDERFDGLLVPSKVYGIMAAARPIVFVGSARNHIAAIIERSGCGIRVSPEDPEGLVTALRFLRENPEEAAAMGRRGRECFEREFERDTVCRRFADLLISQGVSPGRRGPRELAHPVVSREYPLAEAELPAAASVRE